MNSEQLSAFEKAQKRKNIFITGAGGCGKSFTLNHIIKWARERRIECAVTASTGCAAYLIQGRTIHSYLGIGLAKKTAKELADFVKWKKPFIVSKLRALEMLIIDEISMINAELFDKISEFLSLIRGSSKPFGGVQIILCGDFAQLPPTDGKYCFLANIWEKSNIETITLKTMMRQSDDNRLQEILEELRWGLCTKDTLRLLKSLKHTNFANLKKNGIIPTVLYSMNVDVDAINEKQYKELIDNGAETCIYKTVTSISGKSWSLSMKIPEKVELCIGAQVVLTWNVAQDDGLINGSRGVVIGFDTSGPIIRFVNGRETVIEITKITDEDDSTSAISFMPIRLAYALTIHKSQGMTLDAVILDLGDSIFEYGQAYTALSRARGLEFIKIISVKSSSFKTHKDVLNFYKK